MKDWMLLIFLGIIAFVLWSRAADAADAYENTCTTGDIDQCIARPCDYIPGYTGACDEVYSACHDPAATVPCGWAICGANGEVVSHVYTPHVPGIGPTCPAGWVKLR